MELIVTFTTYLLLVVNAQIFEPFGPVELVQLPLDLETGQCKGFGFVQVSDSVLICRRLLFCLFVAFTYLFMHSCSYI